MHGFYKLEQISRMDEVYSRARAVLVLDSGLMSMARPIWGNALLAQLMSSVWATRSWCFQESALASCLVFQFQDRMLLVRRDRLTIHPKERSMWIRGFSKERTPALKEIQWLLPSTAIRSSLFQTRSAGSSVSQRIDRGPERSTLERVPSRKFGKVVDPAFLQHFLNQSILARAPWSHDSMSADHFTNTWNLLVGRYTTKEDDAPLIWATLLDLQIDPLLAVRDTRIRTFWIVFSFGSLPVSLLFSESSRMSDCYEMEEWWLPCKAGSEVLPKSAKMKLMKNTREERYEATLCFQDICGRSLDAKPSPYVLLLLTAPLQSCTRKLILKGRRHPPVRVYRIRDLILPAEAEDPAITSTTYVLLHEPRTGQRHLAKRAIYLYPCEERSASEGALYKFRPLTLTLIPQVRSSTVGKPVRGFEGIVAHRYSEYSEYHRTNITLKLSKW